MTFFKALATLLFLVAAACAVTSPARADAIDDALGHFAQDKFPETDKGIDSLSGSGAPTAAAVMDALANNRLLFDPGSKQIFYKDASDTLFDAKTGAKAEGVDASTLKKVRLNNAVRSKLQSVGGSMALLAPDPTKRLDAANAVFRSHDANQLAPVETALAKENDAAVKAALLQARAAILATKPDATADQRLDAIQVLKLRGDQDAQGLLTPLATVAPDDASMDKVRTAAKAALSAISMQLAIWQAVQNVWYGVSLGSVLLLAAIGLAITFGVMGIINMAHGEMVMIGAYTTFVVQQVIRTSMPGLFDASLIIAVPLAFLVSGAVGIAIERLVIRHLYGRPLETLLATWGISLILQQAVRTTFGANNKEVGAPSFMSGSFHLGGLEITSGRMWIIAFTICVFVALQLVLRATPFGLRMRAVTQNRRMASAMGISTGRIDALAFGLGSGIAGIAGVALSQIDNVSPNLGQSYIIDSFMVVVFGGVGNLWGTLVAALALGIANKFLEPLAGAVLAKIAVLVFIILFIQKRPRGLFALKGRSVEA
ncbi:urea ABC transporter permease subunit UrtB [Hyphomicrobiales bacterium BP6-180914]|uniref:Urea ABC transporter permease subunit UrtB n=2 Tax=Lichenifustis flavocetrariae TaxID=2949735 RepID=A0AA41Z8W4_9HYPH|nr:urea ABC transporter permease subunit UrtB [Lichenifustis flavocetrariae]MCW6512475.1 urea ABC transporter permease subunit UrtB [Lichenifustis flavocetrariae]